MAIDKSAFCGIMSMDKPVKLEQSEIAAIERTLAKGERVELIPVKDGAVRIVRVRRDEVK
jgi:hypothetical protein